MTKQLLSLFSIFALVVPVTLFAGSSGEPGEKLSALAFLTAHDWEAKLPDSADGKNISIRAHLEWGQNHQAIIFRSAFVTNGTPAPYVDGMYLWNPEKRTIEMIYTEGDGTLTQGTMQPKEGTLLHEFRQIHPDGKVEEYSSHLTPQGTEKWTNEVFMRKGGQLTKMVEVQYVAVK